MSETAVTVTVYLPVKFDQYRERQLNTQLVDARLEELRLTEHLKSVSDSLKAKIKEEQKNQNNAARALKAGYEMKDVACEHRVDLDRNKTRW